MKNWQKSQIGELALNQNPDWFNIKHDTYYILNKISCIDFTVTFEMLKTVGTKSPKNHEEFWHFHLGNTKVCCCTTLIPDKFFLQIREWNRVVEGISRKFLQIWGQNDGKRLISLLERMMNYYFIDKKLSIFILQMNAHNLSSEKIKGFEEFKGTLRYICICAWEKYLTLRKMSLYALLKFK